MRVLLLILLVSCGLTANNEFKNLNDLLKGKNHNRVQVQELSKGIIPWYIEGEESDTSRFMLPSFPSIKVMKIDNGENARDVIQISDKEFAGKIEYDANVLNLDMDYLNASVYELRLNNKKFVCIASSGTGLLRSGVAQQVTFFVLIDMTDSGDENVYFLYSYDNSTFAFDDINDDGNMDFLRVRLIARDGDDLEYIFEKTSLHGGKFDKYTDIGRVKRIKGVYYLFDDI